MTDDFITAVSERDDIAKHVAGSILAEWPGDAGSACDSEEWPETVARWSYLLADALMARGKELRAIEENDAAQGVTKLSSP